MDIGAQLQEWLGDAVVGLFNLWVSMLPETWLYGLLGLCVGYLWGKFGLPGLVSGVVAVAYFFGHITGLRKKAAEAAKPEKKKRKTLF